MSQQSIVRKSPAKEPVRKAPASERQSVVQQRSPSEKPVAGGPLAAAGPAVTIGGPNDQEERQAEQVADKVVAGEPAPAIPAAPTAGPVRKSPTSGRGAQEETLAAKAIAEKGPGRPLAPETKSSLEHNLGRDLGAVRVHDDPAARQSAAGIGARAFTHGRDIFLGPGESANDTGLMAHEATHVLQQGGGVRKARTRGRSSGTGGSGAMTPAVRQQLQTLPQATGRLVGNDVIMFDEITIPPFKMDAHRGRLYNNHLPLKRKKNYDRGNTQQRKDWKDYMATKTNRAETVLRRKHRDRTGANPGAGELTVFQGKTKHNAAQYFFGDLKTVATELSLPEWDKDFNGHHYQVDHIVELQLGDWNTNPWPNTPENMELLDDATNMGSGSTIDSRINAKAREFIRASNNVLRMDDKKLLRNFHFHFDHPTRNGAALPRNLWWSRQQIENAEHLEHVTSVDPNVLSGGPNQVRIFGDHHGQGKLFTTDEEPHGTEGQWLAPFEIVRKDLHPQQSGPTIGKLYVRIVPRNPHLQPFEKDVTVERVGNLRGAGNIAREQAMNLFRGLRAKKTSPIRVDEVNLDNDGLSASGVILPEAPFLRNANLGFRLEHGNVEIFKRFSSGDFTVPRPFRVSDVSLELAWGTRSGFSLTGQVDFGVERLGEGYMRAGVSQADDLTMEGRFSFDTEMFEQAEVNMWYRQKRFGGSGDLRVGPGKVRGIRSGSLHVEFGEGSPFRLNGSIQPSIPGVQEGTVRAEYSDAQGLMIAGTLQLTERIPGIRGGRVEVQLNRSPEGEYELAARGTAEPRIPGVNGSISVAYANGIFTAEGSASYARGPMSGQVQIGVTNGPVESPTETPGPARSAGPGTGGGGVGRAHTGTSGPLRAYGGGQVSLRLAPWLQGTIGVRLLPNGEIEVTGQVGLPGTLNLFEQRRFDRNLFRAPTLDIPIIGVAAAGQRIGIFFTLTGGLDASASIGPGQLRELGLSVTYNPDHPEQTRVRGRAQLHVPADAGLRMYIRGGLGAGIPIVSASANLEIGGRLGLEGALNAGVQVDWTPARGLVIDALGEIMVQPAFTFDISAVLLVEADIGITTFELYSRRWNLASFRHGTNLQFGLRFPVHYEQGRPFNISLSDIQFIRPEIDPLGVARGIMHRLTGGSATATE